VRSLSVPTTIHGRVLVQDAAVIASESGSPSGLIVAFHGYGQRAEDMLEALDGVPGVGRWRIASVQALHRFYTRGDQKVVASWMTSEDRELAVADNVEYVNRVISQAQGPGPTRSTRPQGGLAQGALREQTDGREAKGQPQDGHLVFVGFSQGASMAYRAALLGAHRASGIIALGGDIPPEVKALPAISWPRVLIGAGVRDEWYGKKVGADVEFLRERGVAHEVVHFDGGHEWTDAFRDAVGAFLEM
jgi:predicted esterase